MGLIRNGIDGAGDSAFVAEYLNSAEIQYDLSLYPFHWYHEIERDLSFRAQFDCVPIDLLHEHHGYLTQRNRHDFVRYSIDGFPPIKELVEIDAKGLLRWKDRDCPERKVFQKRASIQSKNDADRLFEEHGYTKFARDAELKKKEWILKPIFRSNVPSRAAFPCVKIAPSKSKPVETVYQNIFNPEQIFRDEFPLSWCKGIHNKEGSLHIPVVPEKKPPTLSLKRKMEEKHFTGVLPVQPSWEPLDLAPFTNLCLTVFISPEPRSDVSIQLISMDKDNIEQISSPISLVSRGVKRGQPTKLSVPLKQFSEKNGFQLRCTRSVMIVGYNCSHIELAQVYLCDSDDLSAPSPSKSILVRNIQSLKMFCSDLNITLKRVLTQKNDSSKGNTKKDRINH